MAGSRPVSTALLTAASSKVAEPIFFLEIDWTPAVYLCTHSTRTWNGQSWVSSGFEVGSFDGNGKPQRITLADPDNAYRTMMLGQGMTDKRIALYFAYIASLASNDPICVFDGFADGCEFSKGRAFIDLDWQTSSRQFSPRDRIGPLIGVNFVATPGEKITWGDQILTIEARQ